MSIRTAFSELFKASEPTQLELRGVPWLNLERPSTPLAGASQFLNSGNSTAAGENVNEHTAMLITTVYASVRVIAESIGNLPLRVRQSLATGSRLANEHSLAALFNTQPNPDMSPAVFFETMAGNMALWGNGYAEIIRDGKGNVLELYPLNPAQVDVVRNTDTGLLEYRYTEAVSNSQQSTRTILAVNMVHVPLYSGDGLKGLSPIGQNRATLGLSMAALKSGSLFFGNGARTTSLLTPKTQMTPEQVKQMQTGLQQMASGGNQHAIAFLSADINVQALGMSMADSQFLETRAFQRSDIAAMFRVPSHLVGDTTRQSNSNQEQSSLSLIQDTLAPYLNKIEEELQRKLLPSTGRTPSVYSLKFDLTERLRTDLKTTIDTVNAGILSGVYSVNEGRQILGQNSIGAEGDVHYAPINMMNLELFKDWSPQQAKGQPSPPKVSETKSHVPFTPLVRDAVGRLNARQKPTLEAFESIFSPTLQAMCSQAVDEARAALSLSAEWNPDLSKITAETIRSIEHRSGKWSSDHDATAADETQRIYKALKLNVFRDAASTLALQEAA